MGTGASIAISPSLEEEAQAKGIPIALLGLDGSGKTQLLANLVGAADATLFRSFPAPTKAITDTLVQLSEVDSKVYRVYDVPGQLPFRHEAYLDLRARICPRGFVVVVDCSDRIRFPVLLHELKQFHMQEKNLLIVLTKTDYPEAFSMEYMQAAFAPQSRIVNYDHNIIKALSQWLRGLT